LHVRDDARGIIQLGRAKELLRGSEHARPIAERPNEATHCSSDGIIIVDDGDNRSSRQNTDPCDGSAIDNGCRVRKLNMECQQRLQSHTEVYCCTPSLSRHERPVGSKFSFVTSDKSWVEVKISDRPLTSFGQSFGIRRSERRIQDRWPNGARGRYSAARIGFRGAFHTRPAARP
jgi:hypothetical protein